MRGQKVNLPLVGEGGGSANPLTPAGYGPQVDTFVLPKVEDNLPTVPVSPVTRWKHPSDIELADPNYGIPAGVDILLG